MSQVPPRLSDFARRLLSREADIGAESAGFAAALDRACDALHDRLAPLLSSPGFEALLGRSVQLASRDFPFLARVTVAPSTRCSLPGLPGALDGRPPEEVADALTAVLAHFIWLLVIFIGESLGLRKVREVWPEVPFDTTDSSAEVER
ncbi:MAG: hypothetical protein LC791_06835 [Acidobacteria bacterium]|nr:hypothetical protein [Acidobacteriota bacterium]